MGFFPLGTTAIGGRSLILGALDMITPYSGVDKEFDKVIKHLEKALVWPRWVDEGHPDSKHGKKVFYEARHAAKHLEKLLAQDEKKREKAEKGNKGKKRPQKFSGVFLFCVGCCCRVGGCGGLVTSGVNLGLCRAFLLP